MHPSNLVSNAPRLRQYFSHVGLRTHIIFYWIGRTIIDDVEVNLLINTTVQLTPSLKLPAIKHSSENFAYWQRSHAVPHDASGGRHHQPAKNTAAISTAKANISTIGFTWKISLIYTRLIARVNPHVFVLKSHYSR